MSLDDECPTQYHGPNPVTFTAVGAGNRKTTMSQERASRLIAEGVPAYKFAGLIEEPMKNHAEGCAVVRTGRCTCTYLSQWDENAPTIPAPWDQLAASDKARAARTPLEEAGRIIDQHLKFSGPAPLSPQDSLILAATASEAIFPMEEKDYYPQISQDVKAFTVNGEIWEPRQLRHDEELKTKYWHEEYKRSRRGFWAAVGFAATCAAGLVTVLAWAGVL